MNSSSPSRRSILFTVACALGLMLLPIASLHAADKALPVTTSFEKNAHADGAPIVLHVTNTSHESLALSGKVLLAVVNHAMDKARPLPEHTLKAGETLTIKELSAEDKVLLSAHGYETLTIVVPYVK
jgi:hypothetical protein